MNKITLDNPKVVTKTFTYTQFAIKDIIITLNQTARFIVILYGDDTDVVDIEMTPQEYLNWGSDDNYVIQFIKDKLAN
jgi:hypothetical protein